ncbi:MULTISPECIES: UbiH/UbiF family hydroxylase [unclassified Rhizobium]|uniref:UbiH/UbiF family hydroxylase n=1 Tax=unclassified Rhizobium TaxID=2613769 RepID=UPI00177C4CA3|nr:MULTISPECIES: UbiH/UbiF family hydroxylase [unclassified Rhizobium]MBD8687116.1 UbiH/UbiF family hydroxylase [Rhizobium sp. CFBP 13644]MBD8691081.1 UbiH/UbiF family hydroxylase [Rhizobium sp. CFBP 13717]
MKNVEIAVVGAGLAGQITALAIARAGRSVALIAPKTDKVDKRTTALMDQSIRFLNRLGLWSQIEPSAAKLSTMQIIDGTDRLLRAPTVAFRSSEIGLSAFGWNMSNETLNHALGEAISKESNIELIDASAQDIEIDETEARITLQDGEQIAASFLIGADGRQSKVRECAGIRARSWTYPQTAVVLNFSHTRPHGNVSTEFHTPTGPFTQVPLMGDRSSLVWVVTPEQARDLSALSLEDISRRVEERMHSMLGTVTVEDNVQTWPLSSMTASRFGKGRVALVGEAGHGFPPIGAQGLNLSLRDIIVLTDLLGTLTGGPIPADAGSTFDRRRRGDVVSRTLSVDLLNRSLLSSFLPMQVARAAGLHILSNVGPLRGLVMREGIEPGRGLKALPSLLASSFKRSRSG